MAPTPAPSEPSAPGPPEQAVHAADLDALLDRLGASSDGLSSEQAARRQQKFGRNELPDPPKESAWLRFAGQFGNPIVMTLLAASVIAAFVGLQQRRHVGFLARFADAIAILLIVVINAVIGFYQEKRAEAALDALRKLAAPTARVVRGGMTRQVLAAELVPGDLIELEAGDAVPADARLAQTIGLSAEESALTGEASPRAKDALAQVAADAPLAERDTMVFTGTIIVRGKGRAVITHTGVQTELGRIGQLIAGIGEQKTPLEERLDRFGKVILWACIGLSAALMGWGFLRPGLLHGPARPWHTLLLEAVALAVAAIPEGLPAITTITLALGMQRMARRGAIVRKLPAVETLGAATVICSDKTGTLTQNAMTVREVYTLGAAYEVTGEGYDPRGGIVDEAGKAVAPDQMPEALSKLLATAALCNSARIEPRDGRWQVIGDPTEGALIVLAEKGGVAAESVRASSQVVGELPFDASRKRMTIVARDERGREIAHVKGSVEVLLPLCENAAGPDGALPLTESLRAQIMRQARAMSEKALRVLAICHRERTPTSAKNKQHEAEAIERELTFLGLAGMMDPPRPEVARAVATCQAAGIRPVMITGDDKDTARAVADKIGMWSDRDEAITGAELEAMDEPALALRIDKLRVFARTTPEQKLRIVRAFKRSGHVVAMTGDGVNDAPALREANIGVAMGKMGTDVARQAADLVLADDNFATIVDAVREGRAIYRNIQKFIFFLLSANMGLVVGVFIVSLFPSWPPLTPLMVLWINLVTNGLPALALGVDPPDERAMQEPPRDPAENLMVFRDYLGILYVGVVMGAAAIAIYLQAPQTKEGLAHARALAFTLLALSPLMHAFSCRSPIRSLAQMRPLVSLPLVAAVAVSAAIHLVAVWVPSLQPIFRTFRITTAQWVLVLALSALVLPAVEIGKLFNRAWFKGRGLAPRSLAGGRVASAVAARKR